MTLELRTKSGRLIATFSGNTANQVMQAANETGGHWRTYRTADMKHQGVVFNVDVAFEFGKKNPDGEMAIQIFTDYILIEIG